jgi:predicted nucleotidyltransferase
MSGNEVVLKLIGKALTDAEHDESCSVLYACESGSRAWGFASPDSDYDVRFIYVHRLDWYLDLNVGKDTVDRMLPNDLDLSGWELRKTLRLFHGCNLALNEWVGSPVVYADDRGVRRKLEELVPEYFNPKKAMFHYLNMARKASEALGSDGTIPIKKLFYMLRPLLASCWVQQHSTMPPTAFRALLDAELAPNEILSEMNGLLVQKAEAAEGYRISVPAGLLNWCKETSASQEAHAQVVSAAGSKSWAPLNKLFQEYVVT